MTTDKASVWEVLREIGAALAAVGFGIAVLVSIGAMIYKAVWWDAQVASVTDAGTVVRAAMASESSGVVVNGVGAVSAGRFTTIETTLGAYAVDGHAPVRIGAAMLLQTHRDGSMSLCVKDGSCMRVRQ